MTPASLIDPFGPTVNRAHYVPRTATERVLRRLETLLASGRSLAALSGPAGIGKTMLVRVLVDRLRQHSSVILLPYPRLSAPELCAWALRLLGEPAGRDPERRVALRALEERSSGSALVLALDDAQSMLPTAAQRIGELVRGSEGALRVLVAANQGPEAERVLGALGPDVDEVSLSEPMTAEETARYVRSRLDAAHAPASMRAAFDAETVARLHQQSGGIPGRLHQLAAPLVGAEPYDALSEGDEHAELGAAWNGGAETVRPSPAPLPAQPHAADRPDRARPQRAGRPTAKRRRRPRASLLEAVGVVALVAAAAIAIPLITPRVAREMASAPDVSAARSDRMATTGTMTSLEPPSTAKESAPAEPAQAPSLAEPPLAPAPTAPLVPPVLVNVNAVPWAKIEVDGQPAGVTPIANLPLAPGSHRFLARLPDGRSIEREVEIGPDQRHVLFGGEPPEAVPPAVEVSINAVPWAEIEVDGRPVGVTPLAGLELAPGSHRFRARMPDGRVIERVVEVGPESRNFSFE